MRNHRRENRVLKPLINGDHGLENEVQVRRQSGDLADPDDIDAVNAANAVKITSFEYHMRLHQQRRDTSGSKKEKSNAVSTSRTPTTARGRESVLFIGTQFSNLCSGYASQRPRGCVFGVCVLGVCVQVCARTFSGLSAFEPPVMSPPAPWLSHFALCLPDLSQTPP